METILFLFYLCTCLCCHKRRGFLCTVGRNCINMKLPNQFSGMYPLLPPPELLIKSYLFLIQAFTIKSLTALHPLPKEIPVAMWFVHHLWCHWFGLISGPKCKVCYAAGKIGTTPCHPPLHLQWGASDLEIKVPSGENPELKHSLFKAQSRSVYSHTCYAYCQGFLPCLFLPFRSIHLHFFQNLC